MKREQSQSIQKEQLATKKSQSRFFSKGFSLVEVVLATAIFSLLVTAFVGAYLYGQEATMLAGSRARAGMLAEEELEAARNIRDAAYSNLVNSAGTGLSTAGSQWGFSGSSDLSDIFTRQMIISSVDPFRQSVTTNVTWQQNAQRAGATSLVTRLTNWTRKGSVTFVSASSGAGASITIPVHQIGDLLVIFAYRDGSVTAPTLPAGWTNIGTAGGANLTSSTLGYRVATATNDTSGTWTNATALVVHIYHGQNTLTPIGANADTGAASTTVTYPAVVMTNAVGTSWVVGFAGHNSINTTLETPPTGMIVRTNFVDATDEVAGHDTNTGVASWAATNVLVGGTSSGWRARTLEILSN